MTGLKKCILATVMIAVAISRVLSGSAAWMPSLLTYTCNISCKKSVPVDYLRVIENSDHIEIICNKLEAALNEGNTAMVRILSDSLSSILKSGAGTESPVYGRAYYLMGVSSSITGREDSSSYYFVKALNVLEKYPDKSLKSRVLYFMGYIYNKTGDHIRSAGYFSESLELKKEIFGPASAELVPVFLSLSIAKMNIGDYANAIELTNKGIELANRNMSGTDPADLALLYQNKGAAQAMISEYRQATVNLLKALNIYDSVNNNTSPGKLNLLVNIATSFYYLRDTARCIEFFEKGYGPASGTDDINSFYFMRNYAMVLGKINQKEKGRAILEEAVKRLKKKFTPETREYTVIMANYAEYLLNYNKDYREALSIYKLCYNYVNSHPWDINLNNQVALGYALSVMYNGNPETALDSVNNALFRYSEAIYTGDPLGNPDTEIIKKNSTTWNMLRAKYHILRQIYDNGHDIRFLKASAVAAELMINITESMRIILGREESRMLFGERFRDSYIYAIDSYYLCHKVTSENDCLEKVFTYSEKSKATSLLTHTREMRGLRYYVPAEVAAIEQDMTLQAGYYESKIYDENGKMNPDKKMIDEWTGNMMSALEKKDSLVRIIEKEYPGYYRLKYDTRVVSPGKLLNLVGKDANYVSYIVNDTSLYIIVLNIHHFSVRHLLLDSLFFSTVNSYRQLLSEPVLEGNARESFIRFQKEGHLLYSYLLGPVRDDFVPGRLIIAPDNQLSFFPFETLLSSDKADSLLFYGRLDYLMKEYRISYTYSATLLAETSKTRPSFFNNAVVFAPSYGDRVILDSLPVFRQQSGTNLPVLHYARHEAQNVSGMITGKLFIDNLATEEAYKNNAGNYDIVHLAMHTVVDGASPGNYGMIFYPSSGFPGDIYLRPYEIYGVPLNAKMVVLSSCYTGSGVLYAGEGVLSLARSFIISGSRSVIMSLWEVDDMAGSEIIRRYYKNIKRGMSKSEALKKARIDFLEEADMRLSHPFYWSNLVIYGDDAPLYISWHIRLFLLILLSAASGMAYYFLKKR